LVGVIICEGASMPAKSSCTAQMEVGTWSYLATFSTFSSIDPSYTLRFDGVVRRLNRAGEADLPLIDQGQGKLSVQKTCHSFLEYNEMTLVEVSD
jgi:hypothetical protein